MRVRLTLATWTILLVPRAAIPEGAADTLGPVVREERIVQVDGASETWRLEWLHPPSPVCAPDDADWFTCPCHGFEFGEHGELDLVRTRSSREIDRLHLSPFFGTFDGPTEAYAMKHAALRRWPVLASDIDFIDANPGALTAFRTAVVQRTPVTVLELADFDRDGWAAEFILQIGTMPCGKHQSVLVGVSRDRPRLHVFGSAAHPDEPLVLSERQWERLRTTNGPLRMVTWECGDHASEVHDEIVLEVDEAGIHATHEKYSCDALPGEAHGKLLSRKVL